jgi:hypothetical protein
MLSEQLIQELRDILHQECGVEISKDDAARAAVWLAAYFDVLTEAIAQD